MNSDYVDEAHSTWFEELINVEVEVDENVNSNPQNTPPDNNKVVLKKKKYEEVK